MASLTGADFSRPSELLTIGAIVWLVNVIAFALWFWHLEGVTVFFDLVGVAVLLGGLLLAVVMSPGR